MATTKLREELSEKFGEVVAADEQLIGECIKMCEMFNMGGEDLFFKWEAFSFNSMRSHSIFTMDSALALKSQIQRDIATENSRKQQARPALATSVNKGRASGLSRMNIARNPPSGVVPVKTALMPSTGNDERGRRMTEPSKVTFSGPKRDQTSRMKRAYRYMYEKISERSEALDDRIDEFAELIREHYNISDFGDPSASTEEETTIIGRITHDSESISSDVPTKLTETSLSLESSRMMGSGARVPLRFEPHLKIRGGVRGAGGVGLFPGAIVAMKGRNGGGGWFSVSEILAMPPLKVSPGSSIKPDPDAHGDTSFSLFIASGPYSPDSDLSYSPWKTLLETIKSDKPAVVLLIGPFIDTSHPSFKSGNIDSSPTSIFRTRFLDPLRTGFLESSPGTIVLLAPSVRDAISDHPVFPQCELGAGYGGHSRILLLPNPCRFSLNDVSFAVSSVDVLFHLRKEEFIKRAAEEVDPVPTSPEDSGSDGMSKLCRHVLHQRSFYPIFPVPLDVSHEVNLDITHAQEGLRLDDEAPDVLILPSRLKHFSKVVDGTIAVNPSFLTKGTYATVLYSGHSPVPVKDRIRVDIPKLDS